MKVLNINNYMEGLNSKKNILKVADPLVIEIPGENCLRLQQARCSRKRFPPGIRWISINLFLLLIPFFQRRCFLKQIIFHKLNIRRSFSDYDLRNKDHCRWGLQSESKRLIKIIFFSFINLQANQPILQTY